MQSEIKANSVDTARLNEAAEAPAAAANASASDEPFSIHMRELDGLLADAWLKEITEQFAEVLASAPDPSTGQAYPAAMVQAYHTLLQTICTNSGNLERICQALWLPAAIAQDVIRESASSDNMRAVLLGTGALAEDMLR